MTGAGVEYKVPLSLLPLFHFPVSRSPHRQGLPNLSEFILIGRCKYMCIYLHYWETVCLEKRISPLLSFCNFTCRKEVFSKVFIYINMYGFSF